MSDEKSEIEILKGKLEQRSADLDNVIKANQKLQLEYNVSIEINSELREIIAASRKEKEQLRFALESAQNLISALKEKYDHQGNS